MPSGLCHSSSRSTRCNRPVWQPRQAGLDANALTIVAFQAVGRTCPAFGDRNRSPSHRTRGSLHLGGPADTVIVGSGVRNS